MKFVVYRAGIYNVDIHNKGKYVGMADDIFMIYTCSIKFMSLFLCTVST